MSPKRRNHNKRPREERRENVLRPCRYLGNDRDSLAVYLHSRGAYEIAELQFRRAIWLNPFEPRFKAHLAWCLHKQGRHSEASAYLSDVLHDTRDEEIRSIATLIKQSVAETKTEDCK